MKHTYEMMGTYLWNGKKCYLKEKMLAASILSISHNVFKIFFSEVRKNPGLFSKDLFL